MSREGAPGPPRLLIQDLTPRVEGGRHPVKRIAGDLLEVGADVLIEGQGRLSARLCFRPPGERRFRHAPLEYRFEPDRWLGWLRLDRIGLWQLAVEAWPDRFGTWREELRRRAADGENVAPELEEGARLLRWRARGARARARRRLEEAAARLLDRSRPPQERLAEALSEALVPAMSGPLRPGDLVRSSPLLEVAVDRERARFGAWYELFPRSQSPEPGRHGTLADVERRLPELAELGFDVLYLTPIHPIGTQHRKGPNDELRAGPGDPGSPWAIGDASGGHDAVHPELGTLEDFDRLVARAKSLGLEIALDYALHCSPDHPWVREHPGWFRRRPDGSIRYAENPPKKWQDVYPLDFWCADREGLWRACRDLVLFWIGHGVRIFRADNPHTKPFAFWEWLIADVKRTHPDAIFLGEAFTRPKILAALAKLGFSQSYTYFTWKNSASELRAHLSELASSGVADYLRPNLFANTPDVLHEYLQRGGRPAFQVRLVLAATLSPSYGIYSGFELCEREAAGPGSEEYRDSEKYQLRWRDWDAPGNLKPLLGVLNRIRRENPALQRMENLEFLGSENEQILWYRKSAPGNELLVAVNLDPAAPQHGHVELPLAALGRGADEALEVEDLLTGARYQWRGERAWVRLDPAERVAHVLRVT
jgi:starch synthase (maltosyl-transferring)